MLKFKISEIQSKSLLTAQAKENAYREQLQNAQRSYQEAVAAKTAILDVIAERFNVDAKQFSRWDIKDGEITFTPLPKAPAKASERIRKAVKQNSKKNGKVKAHS